MTAPVSNEQSGTSTTRLKICVVSSVGGHLSEVLQLKPLLDEHECIYILNAPKKLPEFMQGRTHFIAHAERDPLVLWNIVECWRILRRERPDILISTGAGPAVPAYLVAGLLGIRCIFIESFCAIHEPSLTGRLIYSLGLYDEMLYQWPYLERFFPKATYGGTIYRPPEPPWPRPRPNGPVFVTVGNAAQPFDRMLRMAEEALRRLGRTDVVWQVGTSTSRPTFGEVHDFLTPERYAQMLDTASHVICQAGAGSVMEAVHAGHKPIVIPRRGSLGELVNDHQMQLGNELQKLGWLAKAESTDDIVHSLRARSTPSKTDFCIDTIEARVRVSLAKLVPRHGGSDRFTPPPAGVGC